jgi:hypothetical protein
MQERDKLADSDFALPETRAYPIHDEIHARAALSEVAKHGTDEEKAKVRAAVKKRWPKIDVDGHGTKKMSLVVDKADGGIFVMSLIGGVTETPIQSDLFFDDGEPFPKEILGEPCTYAWKDISSVGDWRTTEGFPFPVDMDRLHHWHDMHKKMWANGVKVPYPDSHQIKTAPNNGWMMKTRIVGDRIQGLMQIIGDDSRKKAAKNDVSVGVDSMLIDGAKRVYPDAIQHVAMTMFPANPGLNEAVLAASRAAAGSPATPPPAAQPTERSHTMAATLTDAHVGALRKLDHLGMSNVPDEKIGDHLVDREGKEAENLRQMCMSMPGGSECPPGEQMSRAVQHVKTMSNVLGRLLPKNMSLEKSKPEEIATYLNSRIDTLEGLAATKDATDAEIKALKGQVQEMSRKLPVSPFVDENSEITAIENMSMAYDQLSGTKEKPGLPQFFVDLMKKMFISADGKTARVHCMSRAHNPGGNNTQAVELLNAFRNLLDIGPTPLIGERSRLQTMDRRPPGQVGPTAEQNKAGGDRLKKAMGVKVPA